MKVFDLLYCRSSLLGLLVVLASFGCFTPDAHSEENALRRQQRSVEVPERSMQDWIDAFQRAPQQYSFKGVFLVSVPNRVSVASSRVVHWARQGAVIERIEALQGDSRITFREGSHVVGIFPGDKLLRIEELQRSDWNSPVAAASMRASPHYRVVPVSKSRVAGWDAYVLDFKAIDAWRMSYRIWSDVQRGLILKMQTLNPAGRVLEQREFVELAFDVTHQDAKKLRQEMQHVPSGYRVSKFKLDIIKPEQDGWQIAGGPPGFDLLHCFTRTGETSLNWMQCVFSDGLSYASVFIERGDEKQTRRSGRAAWGAMHTVADRLQHGDAIWWMTAVGEAPFQTLSALTASVSRGGQR